MFKSSALGRFSLIVLCALPLAAGCENGEQQADRAASKKVADAEKSRAGATDVKMLDVVQQTYDSAASQPGMSVANKIVVRGRQAQLRYERAMNIVGQLRDKESSINQSLNDLENLALQIAASQSNVVALQSYDPASQIDAIKGRQNDLQEQINTLNTSISDLNSAISARQSNADALHKTSDAALDQAETLDRRSEGETGDVQTTDLIRMSDLRRDAGIADAKAQTLAIHIATLKTDLATAQMRKTSLQATIDSLDNQIQALQGEWTGIQQQIDVQKKLQQKLIGDDSTASDATMITVTGKIEEVAKLQQDANGLRDTAITELNGAVDQFTDATNAAEQLRSKMVRTASEKPNDAMAPLWKESMETLHPMYYKLQKIAAMQSLAAVYASKTEIQILTNQLLDGAPIDAAMRSSPQFKAMGLGPTTAPSIQPTADATAAAVPATQPTADATAAATTQPSAAPTTQPAAQIPGLASLMDQQKTGIPSPHQLSDLTRTDPDQLKQAIADVDSRFKDIADACKGYGADNGASSTARNNIALMTRALANRRWAQFDLMTGDTTDAQDHQHDADSDEGQVDPAFKPLATSMTPAPVAATTDNSAATPATAPSN